MVNFREELSKIKASKSEGCSPKEKIKPKEKYELEEMFKEVIIPYFDLLSLEELEKGVELFVHYHERYFLMGANKTLLFREDSTNMCYTKKLVEQLKKKFMQEDFKIEEYSDGFSAFIQA